MRIRKLHDVRASRRRYEILQAASNIYGSGRLKEVPSELSNTMVRTPLSITDSVIEAYKMLEQIERLDTMYDVKSDKEGFVS